MQLFPPGPTLAAAFLVNEQYHALHLAVRSKKVLLGLASSQVLYADPGGPPPQWPAGTLEAALPAMAARGQCEVYGLVYAWLGQDSGSPFNAWRTKREAMKLPITPWSMTEGLDTWAIDSRPASKI